MPIMYMMVGIPGSGKSTWIKNYLEYVPEGIQYVVLSTDDFVEKKAAELNTTYDAIWAKTYGEAVDHVEKQLKKAIESNMNIIWDQTNLTKKTRMIKLLKIPESYSKYYCYFEAPNEEELYRRLDSRPGKVIPKSVIEHMKKIIQVPTLDEGFVGYVV